MKLKHKITGGMLSVFLLAILMTGYSINMLSNIQVLYDQGLSLESYVAQATTILLVLAGLILVVFVVLSTVIAKSILTPIRNLSQLVTDVSAGHLNVNINRTGLADDEIGALATNLFGLVETLKMFGEDLTTLEHAFDVQGDITHRIDTSKYQNDFYAMAHEVNTLVEGSVNDMLLVLNSLTKVTNGEFDLRFPDMPGKKMLLPQTLRELVQGIQAVDKNINAMVHALSHKDGDMSFKIKTQAYAGGWKAIMTGLNTLSDSIMNPLMAIDICLKEMVKGNFDLHSIDTAIQAAGYSSNVDDYSNTFRDVLAHVEDVANEVSVYIEEITKDINLIGGGDLTTVITREFIGDFGPIKDGLNTLSERLKHTMVGISAASVQVLEGAVHISESAVDMANGASRQANAVQELTATIELINNQTQQNRDNANTAHDLSNKSTENAHKGNNAMQEMLVAMKGIKDSSDNISKIIQVIQDIAFQTNLLALNASVEAARAGEHGKGFAVVADEVRSLAGRSQTAAVETTGLIEDSVNRVGTGSGIAETTADSLTAIVANADEVLSAIDSIARSSSEQAEAVGRVSESIAEISAALQNNSAATQQTTAASQELSSQADVLKQLISYFKI